MGNGVGELVGTKVGVSVGLGLGGAVGNGVGELVGVEVGGTVGVGLGGVVGNGVGWGDGAKVATETPVTSAVLISRRRESMNDKSPVEKPTRDAVKHLSPHIVEFTASESLVST